MQKSNCLLVSVFIGLLLFSRPSYSNDPPIAEMLRLDYSSFYSHLRKINDEELQSLQFAFGFLDVRTKGLSRTTLCQPKRVLIHTDKKDIPIEIGANQRFVLPTERALKLAKAEVHIWLNEATNRCDLSVLLEVKPELLQKGVTKAALQDHFIAFKEFFDQMGGFLSFMMPSPTGLHVKFKPGSEEPKKLFHLLKPETDPNVFTLLAEGLGQLSADTSLQDIEAVTAFVPK